MKVDKLFLTGNVKNVVVHKTFILLEKVKKHEIIFRCLVISFQLIMIISSSIIINRHSEITPLK